MSNRPLRIPDTATAVEYLASTLSVFMDENRLGGQRWTKRRVADYITASPDIRGAISDTTVGRFLDPNLPQYPNRETITLIAEFLVHMKAASQEQLDTIPNDPAIELASAIQRFYKPFSESLRTFHDDLRGHYIGAEINTGYYLRTHLVLSRRAAPNLLLADEFFRLSRIGDPASFTATAHRFDPSDVLSIDRALLAAGGKEIALFSATGAAVLTDTVSMVLIRAKGHGLSGTHTVGEIVFDRDERVRGFSTDRSIGWQVREDGGFNLPSVIRSETTARNIVKIMCRTNSFHAVKKSKKRSATLDKNKIRKLKSMEYFDFVNFNKEILDKNITKNNTKKVNTKLLSALDLGDLDGFEAALADGADPNLIPHDSDLPLVFTLAADGRLEWVEALLKTGRCDVTRTDHNGLRPSIAPGATARRLTHEETASDLRERFAAIALMLRAEESRQINRKGSDFPAP